jgi:hypothetical protein
VKRYTDEPITVFTISLPCQTLPGYSEPRSAPTVIFPFCYHLRYLYESLSQQSVFIAFHLFRFLSVPFIRWSSSVVKVLLALQTWFSFLIIFYSLVAFSCFLFCIGLPRGLTLPDRPFLICLKRLLSRTATDSLSQRTAYLLPNEHPIQIISHGLPEEQLCQRPALGWSF